MNYQKISRIEELRQLSRAADPRVIRHDIVFQMRVAAYKGQPVTDDTPYGKALMDTDDKVYDALPRAVTNWTYRDYQGIEGARLEIYQPEFGHDDAVADDVTLYDIAVGSTSELPVTRANATEEKPISVQQLVEEIVPLVIRMYGEAGVTLELHQVTYAKKYESSSGGHYNFE